MKIGLVGCGKSKLTHAAPARELYTGTLFGHASAYAEKHCDAWVILSARHGVLDPWANVAPYDETLVGASKAARDTWCLRVGFQLGFRYPQSTTLVLLAGATYEGFEPHVNYAVEYPLRGLSIGKRLQWLKAQVTA